MTVCFDYLLPFIICMQINIGALNPVTLVAFMQGLGWNRVHASAVADHISTIKANLALKLDTFKKLGRPLMVTLTKVIDIRTLYLIVQTCDTRYIGLSI